MHWPRNGSPNPISCIRILRNACASRPEARARCGSAARRDLCGGCWVIGIPTATFARKKQVGMRLKETTMWYCAVGCIVTFTLSLLAAPLGADAQPSAKVARIVCLSMTLGPGSAQAEVFRQGLRELGYVEGHNLALEFHAAGETD